MEPDNDEPTDDTNRGTDPPPASTPPRPVGPPPTSATASAPAGPAPEPGAGARTRSKSLLVAAVVAVVAVVGGVVVATTLIGDDDETTAAGEVFLEPVQSVGTDPFFADTAAMVDVEPVLLPARDPVSPTPEPTDGDTAPDPVATQAISGAEPGLYGGTRDNARCNRLQLVEFLEANPDKATAWAEVQGIEPAEIRAFTDTLTPAVLLADTRVTNHGFRDGRATPIQSVLQAGTAVLIDDTGMPRARCACGNPLNRPIPQSTVRYTGPEWTGFDSGDVRVVSPGPGTDQFVLQDLDGGEPFARPAGGEGDDDFDAPAAAIGAIKPQVLVPELGDPERTVAVGGQVTPGTAQGLDGDADDQPDQAAAPGDETGDDAPATGDAPDQSETLDDDPPEDPDDGSATDPGDDDPSPDPGGGVDDPATYCPVADRLLFDPDLIYEDDPAGVGAMLDVAAATSDDDTSGGWRWIIDNIDGILADFDDGLNESGGELAEQYFLVIDDLIGDYEARCGSGQHFDEFVR